MKRFLLKRMLPIPLGLVALAAALLVPAHPDWADAYGRAVYPALSSAVAFLPSLAPFSVAEWFVAAFLLFCLGYVAYYARKIVASPGERGMVVYRGAMGAIALCCALLFAYMALCGLNYHRHTFAETAGYDLGATADVDPAERQAELERLVASLADGLGRERAQLGEDADLFAAEPGEFERYAGESVAALRKLAERYPALERPLYSPPKPVLASKLMSYANIGGMFFPFTMESNINVDNPFFTVPWTMAHELAHQCGFMREDEANFIAYLACKESDDALMRYSGLLLAYDNAMGALRKADPEAATQIAVGLAPSVQRDLAERAEHWAQYEGPVQEASNAANDAYLKANNQSDGMRSYGRMVDLLLAEQRAGEGDQSS